MQLTISQIEQDLLDSYVSDLEGYDCTIDASAGNYPPKKPLKILLNFIRSIYASIAEWLVPLLEGGKITYSLLWALFKPNTEVYTNCSEIDQSRCIKCTFGKERERTTPDIFILSAGTLSGMICS